MGNHSGAEGTSEGGHRDTHLWETSRQDRRVHEVYDRLARIAKEANSGRGDTECVSVPEEPYEEKPHVEFCMGGAVSIISIPPLETRFHNIIERCEGEQHSKSNEGMCSIPKSEGVLF